MEVNKEVAYFLCCREKSSNMNFNENGRRWRRWRWSLMTDDDEEEWWQTNDVLNCNWINSEHGEIRNFMAHQKKLMMHIHFKSTTLRWPYKAVSIKDTFFRHVSEVEPSHRAGEYMLRKNKLFRRESIISYLQNNIITITRWFPGVRHLLNRWYVKWLFFKRCCCSKEYKEMARNAANIHVDFECTESFKSECSYQTRGSLWYSKD